MSEMLFGEFNTRAFMAAVEQVRQERGTNWRRFFIETGMQSGGFKKNLRSKKNASISVHTLSALAVWSGIDPQKYMELKKVEW